VPNRSDQAATVGRHDQLGALGRGQAAPDAELLTAVDGIVEAPGADRAAGADRSSRGQQGRPFLAPRVLVVEEDGRLLSVTRCLVPISHVSLVPVPAYFQVVINCDPE
jgi:hypothetical protein